MSARGCSLCSLTSEWCGVLSVEERYNVVVLIFYVCGKLNVQFIILMVVYFVRIVVEICVD